MKEISYLICGSALAIGLILVGCDSPSTLPEVNDVNCRLENVKKISDEEARKRFASMCFRRGTFKPSEPRYW
jgi:entry exclusion lipoprotein TrbK